MGWREVAAFALVVGYLAFARWYIRRVVLIEIDEVSGGRDEAPGG